MLSYDPIDDICETFKKSATKEELSFWKGDILHIVANAIYDQFEELLTCYPNRPELIDQLLYRVRNIYQNFSTTQTSYNAQTKLWTDMTDAHISFTAKFDIEFITKACLGNKYDIEQYLNLEFLDLTSQQSAIRKLAGICLAHFEQIIAEQIAEKQANETPPTTSLVPGG